MTEAPSLLLQGSAFIDGTPVFEAVHLTVAAGQWSCLLGPSGVGKSTVLKLFAGLSDAVHFKGTLDVSHGALAGQVALMAQDDLLMPWLSVLDNVLLGARLRGDSQDAARAHDVLERVGLAQKLKQKPAQLSGGQRQRVALARTLMEDRPIVLLDEPFSALDARTRSMMQDLAAELLQGRTVLHVTHDPAEAARLGQAIYIMTGTGLETIGPPDAEIPRLESTPAVLQTQAALLQRLREAL